MLKARRVVDLKRWLPGRHLCLKGDEMDEMTTFISCGGGVVAGLVGMWLCKRFLTKDGILMLVAGGGCGALAYGILGTVL